MQRTNIISLKEYQELLIFHEHYTEILDRVMPKARSLISWYVGQLEKEIQNRQSAAVAAYE